MSDGPPARIGPGRLVLVVGPSGAGKDTLIGLAREACLGRDGIVFARRVVTRAASPFEDHASLDPAGFRQALASGAFALHWRAHGLHYGLPRTIDADLRAGRTVVANVSRTIVAAARETYADVLAICVTAPPDVLATRLAARGRASDTLSDDRLARAVAAVDADVTIDNAGNPDQAAARLVAMLRQAQKQLPVRDV